MATLREAKIGDTVTVKRIHGEGALKRRIMDMGITKNSEIYVRKVAGCADLCTKSCTAGRSNRSNGSGL